MNEPVFPIAFDEPPQVVKDAEGNAVAIGFVGGRLTCAWTGPQGAGYAAVRPPLPAPKFTFWQRLRGWLK